MLALRAPIEEVAGVARRLGITLDVAQVDAFERYASLLCDWNARVNLTAIVAPREIATKHFLDSLTGLAARRWRGDERVVDVGSGAGFPGVPLAIALPGLRVTLVESIGKKVHFLEEVRERLGLARVQVAQARAEELAHDPAHRETYDVAVARALPELAANLELLLPFLRVGGDAVVYKGDVADELPIARRAAAALGGDVLRALPTSQLDLKRWAAGGTGSAQQMRGHAAPSRPGGLLLGDLLPGRFLVLAHKTRPTPPRYPRRHAERRRKPWK